ncbi:MAG: hypothetical protein KF851_09335 [Pirellulaceae bacterium]|nr:hypothetical protein [Pirellulaceae bacterium]
MSLRANFQTSYLWRYAILAIVCLGFSTWFLYDGFVGYPLKFEAATEWEKLSHLDTDERAAKWREIVAEKNWPKKTPDQKAEEIKSAIPGQYFWGGLTAILGIPALLFFLTSRMSWVERTETGLTTSWGQTIDFSTVTKLDKTKWAKKGIAKATYSDNGRQRVFVFDDFKFEREPLGKMLYDLEQVLGDEQVVGGPRESTPEQPVEQNSDEPSA